MAYVLDIVTTDSYQELECPGTTAVTVSVSNAAIYIGFGTNDTHRPGAAVYPPEDEVLLPVVGGLERTCDAIRVRSYKLGTPANVKLSAH